MNTSLGPNTSSVRAFIAQLPALSPEQIDLVTRAWKQVTSRDRAEAWTRLCRVTTRQERRRIMAAASLARRAAMEVTRRLDRPDWVFWAAAHDAAAGIATGDRIDRHYHTLTAPFAMVMPSLGQYLDHPRHAPIAALGGDWPQRDVLRKGA